MIKCAVIRTNAQNWTLDKIRAGFEEFHKSNGRYPTSHEIDSFPLLPSSRQIQRRYGGLPAIRALLKLNGPTDFTKGDYSSLRAKTIGKRAHKIEKEVYDLLVDRFGKPFVHREYFFSDDKRCRTDFYVYGRDKNFLVDVFYPKDRANFVNCLCSKQLTYRNAPQVSDRVIFLMMNRELELEIDIPRILSNKKNRLNPTQTVMNFDEFRKFIKGVSPRHD